MWTEQTSLQVSCEETVHTQLICCPFISSLLGLLPAHIQRERDSGWRSERVTACICVRSFDDAEQKGVQVSQTARHTEQVIQMSLCSCHSREMPLYRFKQNKYTENKGIIGFKHLVFLRNACRLNSHLQLTEGRKRLSL